MFDLLKIKQQDACDYILTHPNEFLNPIRKPNHRINSWDVLLLSRHVFMEGWEPSSTLHETLFDELFYRYFQRPQNTKDSLEKHKKSPFFWMPPAWFSSLRALPSGARGQVYLAQCRLPWRYSHVGVAIRTVDDINNQCIQHVIGVTAVRSEYGPNHQLGLVSLAADSTLEQCIPQVDQWKLSKIYRVALMVVSAVRDLHNVNLFHSNLQPRNILITGGKLQLVDQVMPPTTITKGRLYGRYPYFAPELEINQASNIFALGIILWQLTSGVVFPSTVDLCPHVYHIGPLKCVDATYQDLWAQCLSKNPKKRPRIDQVHQSLSQLLYQKSSLSAYSHSLEVCLRQAAIAKYLLQYRQQIALPALEELMHGATLKKRMMIHASVSLECFYERKKKTGDSSSLSENQLDSSEWLQIGLA
ncbi:kinase-like domain-containing protein [Sporodiniella umbellata]|nr:kinase-like domain-containing protein [Sporodiniella umbellata]